MSFGILTFFFRIFGLSPYSSIPFGLLIANWIFQRVFRINSEVKSSVHYTSRVKGYSNIVLGEKVFLSLAISGGCYFNIHDGTRLEIGDGTIWAWNCCIVTGNHSLNDRESYDLRSVKIGKNCWIGASSTILPGVELGDNVTVGANSVVTKSFPDNVLIAGNPARIIKTIDHKVSIEKSLENCEEKNQKGILKERPVV